MLRLAGCPNTASGITKSVAGHLRETGRRSWAKALILTPGEGRPGLPQGRPSHPEACCHTRSGAIDTISWSSPLAYALGALPFPVLPGLRRAIAYRNILVGWSIGAVARTMSRVSDDFSEVSRVPGPSARRENLPGIDC
jgi:hypothetical protein